MSSVWNDVRAGWDTALGAVRDSDSAPGGETGATRERRLRLGRNPIAITGQPGSGKTLLYDALTGSVRNGDPAKPRSHDWEKRRMTLQCGARRAQASVIVVPGQESSERERALDTIMSDTSAPQGIIHVVCWGHNKTWDQQAQLAIEDELRDTAEGLTQNSVRVLHLADEADDFRKLRDKIMNSQAKVRLEWLIIAVTKCDLYWDRIDEARDHYLPRSGQVRAREESRFCNLLRGLSRELGRERLKIAVLPISSRLLRHEFTPDLAQVRNQLDDEEIAPLRAQFAQTLCRFL